MFRHFIFFLVFVVVAPDHITRAMQFKSFTTLTVALIVFILFTVVVVAGVFLC